MEAATRKRGFGATRRWLMLGGAVAVAGLAVREYRLTPEEFSGGRLTPAEAHAQAISGDILLVDIRRPDEWTRTGLGEGAYPIDMRREDFEEAVRALSAQYPGRPVALICARGVRSARVANRLAEAGIERVIDVPEGMLGSRAGPGWLATGLPVTEYEETE